MTNINITFQDVRNMALLAIGEARIQTQVSGAITTYDAYSSIVASVINRAAVDGPPNYGNTITDAIVFPEAYSAIYLHGGTISGLETFLLGSGTTETEISSAIGVVQLYLNNFMAGSMSPIGPHNHYYNPDLADPFWFTNIIPEMGVVTVGPNGQQHDFVSITTGDGSLAGLTHKYSITYSGQTSFFNASGVLMTGVLWNVTDEYGDPVRPVARPVSEINDCFPSGTPITLWDGTTKPIEQITQADKILTHTANGTPVAGIVDKLFTNTTNAFIRLNFTDGRDNLIATPGHRFLTETGDYMEIGHMLRLGGGSVRVVEQDGTVITATGEVLEYTAETADMFPVTATKTIAFEGNAVLKQDVQEGWTTYNFEVREHHNYVANGIRVHNDSILSLLAEGDTLVALNDNLTDAAVLRDVDTDGTDEFVILDGVRLDTDVDTRLNVTVVYTPSAADAATGVAAVLAALIDAKPSLASNPLDPGNGNGYGDGVPSDDLDEALVDDRGWTATRTVNGVGVPTLAEITANPLTALATLQGIVDLVNTLQLEDVHYNDGSGDVTQPAFAPVSSAALVGAILGIPLGTEIIPAVTGGTNPITGEPIIITPAVTLNDVVAPAVTDQTEFTVSFGAGITQEEVTKAQDGDDLVFTIANDDGSTSEWRLEDVYADGNDDEIASVNFEDGTQTDIDLIGTTGQIITGTSGADTLVGTSGNDQLFGYRGDDVLYGLDGDDHLEGGLNNDQLHGGQGADTINGWKGRDVIYGNRGNDTIDGGGAKDNIFGGQGDDVITGGEWKDQINGGRGNDTLTGGPDLGVIDVFVFAADGLDGHDTITDFELGVDRLVIGNDAVGYSGLSDVTLAEFGGNVIIHWTYSHVTLTGISEADVIANASTIFGDAGDLIF